MKKPLDKKGRKFVSDGRRVTTNAVAVAEKILGRRIPKGALVHHMNDDPSNDTPDNLAIFPSNTYHRLIHRRMAAQAACGNPDWMKCLYCKQWDDPKNMFVWRSVKHHRIGGNPKHRACEAKYRRDRRAQGLE